MRVACLDRDAISRSLPDRLSMTGVAEKRPCRIAGEQPLKVLRAIPKLEAWLAAWLIHGGQNVTDARSVNASSIAIEPTKTATRQRQPLVRYAHPPGVGR